jgi:3,4-dihydroxy 2-butanone 4-phosphate synthase / GTP cyclohydrolase II
VTDFATVSEAVAAFGRGTPVAIVRDPEGSGDRDLVAAAGLVTPATVRELSAAGRGPVLAALEPRRLAELRIPALAGEGMEIEPTHRHVAVDHRYRTTSGDSAADRAATIRALADGDSGPEDFTRPGSVASLAAEPGGLLARASSAEAAIDLARMAGLEPAGVVAPLAGPLARVSRQAPPVVALADLVAERRRRAGRVERVVETRLPLPQGVFRALGYRDGTGREHLALVHGDLDAAASEAPLVHLHAGCLAGDALRSLRCDCRARLHGALAAVAREGRGVVVHLGDRAGHGVGHPAGRRDDGTGAKILADLGLRRVRLITDDREPLDGIDVVDRVPLTLEGPR